LSETLFAEALLNMAAKKRIKTWNMHKHLLPIPECCDLYKHIAQNDRQFHVTRRLAIVHTTRRLERAPRQDIDLNVPDWRDVLTSRRTQV